MKATVLEIELNAMLLDEIERLREQTRWIPVEERLPEGRQHVLALNIDGERFVSTYTPSIYWGTVTHWMPLPEPPLEVGR